MKIKYIVYNVQDYDVLYNNLFAQLYLIVRILPAFGKHWNDCITPIKGRLGIIKEFGDTKGAIKNRISKKNRQHNGHKKKYKSTNKSSLNLHFSMKSMCKAILRLINNLTTKGISLLHNVFYVAF